MVWFTHSMPQERQRTLQLALAVEAASKQFADPVNKKARAQALNGIPQHGRDKAEARKSCVTTVRHMHAARPGTAISVIMGEFVVMYRKREALVPEWVYETLPKISHSTLRLWMKQDAEGGIPWA